MSTTLTCPKCGSEMRHYERNRVLVDQCTGCGGLFLDRGELEALVAAENAWHQQSGSQSAPQDVPQDRPQAAPAAPPPPPGYAAQPGYQQPAYQQPAYQQYPPAPYRSSSDERRYGYPGHRRRKSFLSELFDD